MAKQGTEGGKEPFIGATDRPEVKLDLDMPVTELRVRDLAAILGHVGGKSPFFEVGKTPLKDYFDKPFPEEVKDFVKEQKHEKVEKPEKLEKAGVLQLATSAGIANTHLRLELGQSTSNVALHSLIDTIERDRGGDSADRQVGDGA